MRTAAVGVLLAVAAVASAAAQGQGQPGTARVRGSVVAADSGTPVRRAAVRLRSETAGASLIAVTDVDGRFEFPAVRAGRFTLSASKPGFVTIGAGQKFPSDPSRPFDVRDGQAYDAGEIRLPRGGAITGRVLDEFGEPVVEAQVRAFRTQYMQGHRRLVGVREAHTNDAGQFGLYGLAPGKYYVSGMQRVTGGGPFEAVPRDVQVVSGAAGFAPTFFPGSVSAGDAQPVLVGAGSETPGIDFTLLPVRLVRVSGTVVDSKGRPAAGYLVMLNASRSDGAFLTNTSMAETRPDGTFVLPNVTPGEYRLDVRAKAEIEAIARTGGVGQPQGPNAAEYASVPMTLSEGDVDGVTVRTSSGFRLAGRVIVEGGPAPAIPQQVRVSAVDLAAGAGLTAPMLAAGAPVQADGGFELRGMSGVRMIRAHGLPAGWALKGVRAGGVDVTDIGIQMVEDVAGLEVVITTRQTRVAGTVTDTSGALAPDAAVIVFPEDRQRRAAPMNRFVVSARPAADATFSVEGLPPGTYLAAAVPTLVDGEWAEADSLERLTAQATRFTLSEGETRTLTLVRRNP